jgi:ADP-heptose:LPS heptosyltransferase
VPQITVTAADVQESQAVVPECDRPLVVLHPGATDPRRRWSATKFAAMGDALAAAGAEVVVMGTDAEQSVVTGVVQAMTAKVHNLCGRLSLGGLAGLLSHCRVVVSNDSGPMHLAIATGTPTVGIYWCGNLITAGPAMRSWHYPALSWRLHCPVCQANCMEAGCNHRASFVDDVAIEDVKNAALQWVENLDAHAWTSPLKYS